MSNHAPRISRAYHDISGTLSIWYDRAERIIVCQHDPDEGCARRHLHVGIWNSEIKEDQLKQLFNRHAQEKLKGNEDWSWKHKDHPNGLPNWEDIPIVNGVAMPNNAQQMSNYKYLRYAIKGNKEHVVFSKGISDDLIAAAADDWKIKEDKPDVIIIEHVKKTVPGFQQLVIAEAYEDWFHYKKECKEKDELVDTNELKTIVCRAMRKHGRGINMYMVRDLAWAVLYDDIEYRDHVLRRIQI